MSTKNVAVIGANGFIGRALTERLAQEKDLKLTLFGRTDKGAFQGRFPYFKFDITQTDQIKKQFEQIDIVYYLISETIPATSWENPLIEIEKNLKPFITFFETIATLKVKKVAFVSSAGTIYGPTEKMADENSDKHPFSPYGITKLTMEHFLNYFEKKYGIFHDIYRVSNVYGAGQDIKKGLGIINTFIEKIILDKTIQIFGDGENTRNYIYIKDVAEFMTLSLRDQAKSSIYNLSSNETLKINDLVRIMKTVIPEDFDVKYIEKRQSDNSTIVLDNTKIKSELPSYKLMKIEDGIRETYTALKENLV